MSYERGASVNHRQKAARSIGLFAVLERGASVNHRQKATRSIGLFAVLDFALEWGPCSWIGKGGSQERPYHSQDYCERSYS